MATPVFSFLHAICSPAPVCARAWQHGTNTGRGQPTLQGFPAGTKCANQDALRRRIDMKGSQVVKNLGQLAKDLEKPQASFSSNLPNL